MSSGTQHDRATVAGAKAIAAVGLPATAFFARDILPLVPAMAMGFLLGGLYLSPDLDIRSRPYRRWGLLRWYWWPYQKLIPHRNWMSHWPIIGTAIRLGYLLVIPMSICLVQGWSLDWLVHPVALSVWAGCEGAALLHLAMDALSSLGVRIRSLVRKLR